MIDAETFAPNSEPLILNVDEESGQLIELSDEGNPVSCVPFSVACRTPTNCLAPALPELPLACNEPDTTIPIGST